VPGGSLGVPKGALSHFPLVPRGKSSARGGSPWTPASGIYGLGGVCVCRLLLVLPALDDASNAGRVHPALALLVQRDNVIFGAAFPSEVWVESV